ncbi:hypothetical protein EMPG_09675 [Blastomyces silverae]|uniref:Uncharacterized protein n=1 Tax=Blastomyces silverae TaxID=2060906 RepID=A0A0H1BQF1_9EURO|nr:hypothetical protein EMPG_09675 [Blastomyces silverae]
MGMAPTQVDNTMVGRSLGTSTLGAIVIHKEKELLGLANLLHHLNLPHHHHHPNLLQTHHQPHRPSSLRMTLPSRKTQTGRKRGKKQNEKKT